MERPPIIVFGMHRSGTTLVTSLLGSIGVFTGALTEGNAEAIFFQNLNNWLLRQSGAEWDNPEPFRAFLRSGRGRELAVTTLRHLLTSPRAILFCGLARYPRFRRCLALVGPWGWKDPRNTYTLPLWLEIFPEARGIHVYRHGVDVAQSLKARAENLLAQVPRHRPLTWLGRRPASVTDSFRCLSLEGGFSLWEEYMTEARGHVHGLGGQAIEVRYEDFLTEPERELQRLSAFCEISPSGNCLDRLPIVRERAFAYRAVPACAKFATAMEERLGRFGYV